MFLYGLILGQGALYADLADPNLNQFDPNAKTSLFYPSPDPNTTSLAAAKPIAGTLAMNWLYQGKKPPQPLVGQEDVTFRTEIYPWPYIGYNRYNSFAGPGFYNPWARPGYWRYYSNDYWKHCRDLSSWRHLDAFTYPLHTVEVQMKLNENTSFNFGVSFISDYLYWP
jgi:hypothetical protein